jgi:hypothetical protein
VSGLLNTPYLLTLVFDDANGMVWGDLRFVCLGNVDLDLPNVSTYR